jgi:mannosyltransferase
MRNQQMRITDHSQSLAAAGKLTPNQESTGLPALLKRIPHLDSQNSAERRRAALFYGGLLVFLALILRIAGMSAEPFWHDEVTMLNIGLGGWDEFVRQFTTGRPPVFVGIAVAWTALFGTGEVVSRVPSLVASVLSVAVFFHLGSIMFNQRIGFLAALVMVVTEFHIYYAQTYRYYAVYVLLILLSYFYFYLLFQRRRWHDVALYVLFTVLALYTHTHGMFAIASQGVFFIVMMALKREWRSRRVISRWLISQGLVLVLIFPGLWMSFLADQLAQIPAFAAMGVRVVGGEVGIGWLQEPSVGSIARALVRFLFFEWYYFNPFGVFTALLFIAAGTVYFAARAGWKQWSKSIRQLPHDGARSLTSRLPEWLLVISWFAGMLLLPWIASFVLVPMFFDRYVLGASPAYYLLLILIIFGIRRVIPAQVIMAAFLVSLAPGLIAFYTYYDNERWNDLAGYVQANLQPNDAIVVLTDDVHLAQPREAFDWYYAGTPTCELYEDKLDNAAAIAGLTDCLTGHDRVWLVALRWQGDFARLAARGLSGSLTEFFETYDSGVWRLAEMREGDPFYLLGMYRYEKQPEQVNAAGPDTG